MMKILTIAAILAVCAIALVSCTFGVRSNISQTSQWQVGRGDLNDTRTATTSPNSVAGDKTRQDEDNLGVSQNGPVGVTSTSNKAASAPAETQTAAPADSGSEGTEGAAQAE